MKKQFDIKKLVLLNLPYLLMGLFATNFGEAWRLAQGANASEKFLSLFAVLPGALQSFWPSLHPLDLLVGLCCGAGLRLAVYLKSKNAKKYRHGMEYGSARWGTREDIAPYIDPVFQNNVILTKTESLTMNSRPKDPKTARNKNVLVIGGSGSGKTRFWLKPNLMQMHSSYVVTDPKGTILVECGKMLQRGAPKLGKDGKPMKDKHGKVIYEPYRIKVLNTINFRKSMHYMIEIYLVTSVAPVPMAAMMGKEWGGMGQNYLRSLLALGFQAFLIIVCVAIYAVLVQNIALEDDIIMAIWSCVGYTVLLCFTLFKTGSLAKSVFQAH